MFLSAKVEYLVAYYISRVCSYFIILCFGARKEAILEESFHYYFMGKQFIFGYDYISCSHMDLHTLLMKKLKEIWDFCLHFKRIYFWDLSTDLRFGI